MFETEPILWLQAWSTPALTTAMNLISLFGYTRAGVAFGALFAVSYRLRPALALLILIAMTGVLVDVAKFAAGKPRPDAVEPRVQVLGAQVPPDGADSGGFPSGHVAVATVFWVGAALLFRWQWAWVGAVVWIPLMAVSRMYLGRHFLGDAIGGVVTGVVAAGLGFAVLRLSMLADGPSSIVTRAARRSVGLSIILAVTSLAVSVPDAGDAGRLVGIATATMVLVRWERNLDNHRFTTGLLLAVIAAVAFAGGWVATSTTLELAGWNNTDTGRLIRAAIPSATMLLLPAQVLARRLPLGSTQI